MVALLILFLGPAVAVILGAGLVRRFLLKRHILDEPTDRSSHTRPKPRGGGIAVIAVILAGWGFLGSNYGGLADIAVPPKLAWVIGAAVFIAIVSWLDDLKGLKPLTRLVAQIVAVTVVLNSAPPAGPVFQGLLPAWLDLLAAGFIWLWFINLFNFMDGIDGISGVETGAIGLGVAAVAGAGLASLGLIAAGAGLGFLWWNKPPAKIFLGDVGSIPLGFLLGWLLLSVAADGAWAAALILPLYYLADATITIGRRAFKREVLWRAHRQHFYQRAVDRGLSHTKVIVAVAVANTLLMALAMSAGGAPWPSVAAAVIVVGAAIVALERLPAGRASDG